MKPCESFHVDCVASFSTENRKAGERLERVAGELLLNVDQQLVRQEVFVSLDPIAAIAASAQPDAR